MGGRVTSSAGFSVRSVRGFPFFFNIMAVYLPPALRIVSWRMGIEYPGQTMIATRLTGRIDTINRGSGLWVGQVAWHIRASAPSERADAMRWIAQLRGRTHQTQLELPRSFGAANAPSSDYAATIGTVTRGSGGEANVTLTVTAGSWTPVAGDMVTVGNRLYAIEVVSGTTLSLAPRQLPTVGAAVDVEAPYVICTSASTEQLALSFQGGEFDRLAFDWVEHLD